MIKRTLYFGNPAYLSCKLEQMVVELRDNADPTNNRTSTMPIEDIGVVVLDHPQITITHVLLQQLMNNNTAVITCNEKFMPAGLLLPLSGNTLQQERFEAQLQASEPLRKQMWQQTVKQKIENQAAALKPRGVNIKNMLHWADEVQSGDAQNHEARAAAYYWGNFFPMVNEFRRDHDGMPPNNLLNYGYAILRAIVARSLVGAGLLPTLGIHHHNRYNAYCLADDIMEPYRPYVDVIVHTMIERQGLVTELGRNEKAALLQIPVIDVVINGERSPLMLATQQTAISVYRYCRLLRG